MRNWTIGRPKRWSDTGSPWIQIHGPAQTRTSRLQLQRLRLDQDLRGRPIGGGSPRTGRLPDLHRSGSGDHRVWFHWNAAKGAATGPSPGRRTGVGGQALCQHSKRIPAGSESIRVYGAGAGADRLRARGKPGSDHPDVPDPA